MPAAEAPGAGSPPGSPPGTPAGTSPGTSPGTPPGSQPGTPPGSPPGAPANSLGARSAGRDNNLNLIRMIAAAAVLVSHAFPIALGTGAAEPLKAPIGMSLGTVAVYIFFGISGFLIAQSFERARSIGAFLAARALRIFPALIMVVALTVLVLGPAVTALPLAAYAADPAVLSYALRNITLAALQYELPGVFAANPYPGVINGSLWTLIHELACYGLVLAAGLAGLMRRGWPICALIAGFALAVAAYAGLPGLRAALPASEKFGDLLRLATPFVIGMALYVWRDRVPLGPVSGPLIAAALTLLAALLFQTPLAGTPLYTAAAAAALVYTTFLLGYLPGGAVRRYNRLGDYSYGVYIYAFPLQQLAMHLFGPMSPGANMALALPATLLCAVLSWHLVEKPALGLRKKLGRKRREERGARERGARESMGDAPVGDDTQPRPAFSKARS